MAQRKHKFVATLRVVLMIEVPVAGKNLAEALDAARTAHEDVVIEGGEILDIQYNTQGVSQHDLWMTND